MCAYNASSKRTEGRARAHARRLPPGAPARRPRARPRARGLDHEAQRATTALSKKTLLVITRAQPLAHTKAEAEARGSR